MVEVISSLVRNFSDAPDFGTSLFADYIVLRSYCALYGVHSGDIIEGQVTAGLRFSVHSNIH